MTSTIVRAVFALAILVSAARADEYDAERADRMIEQARRLHAARRYDEASRLAEQAQQIYEGMTDKDSELTVASGLREVADLLQTTGDLAKAEPLYRRAIALYDKRGPDDAQLCGPLINLGVLLNAAGDPVAAEAVLERAARIAEKQFGKQEQTYAEAIGNLAISHSARGNLDRAAQGFQEALAILEKTVGDRHPHTAAMISNLGDVARRRGKLDDALAQYQRAFTLYSRRFGLEHPLVGKALYKIGLVARAKGDLATAEQQFTRDLEIMKATLGETHASNAIAMRGLAGVYLDRGELDRAREMLEKAAAIDEAGLGADHPDLARDLDDLAIVHFARRDAAQALASQRRANAIRDKILDRILLTGSEYQKRIFADTLDEQTDTTLSLALYLAPADGAATELALATALRRKGRVLDAMSESVSAARARLAPADRAVLDRLAETRRRLAQLVLKGAGDADPAEHAKRVADLEAAAQKLEAELGAHDALFAAKRAPVTLEALRAAIPDDAVVIEYLTFRPFDPKQPPDRRWGPPRFAAGVITRSGPLALIDLGEASAIDTAAKQLRRALGAPTSTDVGERGRALAKLIIDPVQARLAGKPRVMVSPDGALHLVPFAALVDDRGELLLKRYSFSYLAAARDLLRMGASTKPRSTDVIVTNPDFGTDTNATMHFEPLPGTAEEGVALSKLLPAAHSVSGKQATKTDLVALHGPRILHVATHGFFLDATTARSTTGNDRALVVIDRDHTARSRDTGNPLLASGLALAGANQRGSGDGDGIATALEVAGLDLAGTKLVVLSACETGVGQVVTGEGVFGLRRALVLAGAESQVMSLWNVDDAATRDLMIAYYKNLLAGGGRSESLRAAQLAMHADPARAHPYFWAAFIPVGDWRALDGSDPRTTKLATVQPRGCGCSSSGEPLLPLALLVLVVLRPPRPNRQ